MWINAVDVPGPHVDRLTAACAELGVHLAIGVNEHEGDRPGTMYNSLLVIGPGGLLHRHRKLMPTHHARLFHGIGAGDDLGVAETPIGRQHRSQFPADFPVELPADRPDEFSRGGTVIVEAGSGEIVAGLLYGGEGMLIHDCDLRVPPAGEAGLRCGRPLRPRGRPPRRAGDASGGVRERRSHSGSGGTAGPVAPLAAAWMVRTAASVSASCARLSGRCRFTRAKRRATPPG